MVVMSPALIEAPRRLGSREEAALFVAGHLGPDLSNDDVTIDFGQSGGVRPSFVDELVKQILVERDARSLTFRGAQPTVVATAGTSARARSVEGRLRIV
jgi:hypothetical protein